MASKEQNKLIAEQTEKLKAQLGIMRELSKIAQGIDFGKMASGFSKIDAALKSSAESLDNFSTGQQTLEEMNKAAEKNAADTDKMGQSLERFGKKAMKASVFISAIEGAAGGFKLTANAVSMFANVATGLIGTLFNLSASIISLPFKMLYGLMNNVGQGGVALRTEFEKVRGTFGDLTKNEGRDVIQSWRRVDHFGGQLAETGLSVWRTMGNMAESMAAVREIAEKMGPLFHNFSNELNHNGERIFAYKKGLHLTDEGLAAVTQQASRAGTSFEEVGRHITSTAFALGKAFAMNGAMISQDVGTMMDDFDHFGNLSVKQLSQVSVYARKLGVEIEKLTGTLDAFADFDKAAENVSQLSQAFGVQLDTLQMVQEQDPAANIDRLRKAFFATGRTIESMTRQERALLAQTTGLDQKTASLVFSQKNAGLSYGEIQKQGANAEQQQLSQVEAMHELSNSIQRLVKQGPQLKGGFFDIFIQGFFRGVKWTKEFWGLMWKLRYAMRMTYRAGRRVGQMFVRYFPGVKDMLKGMGDLFDRARWRRMLRGVVNSFKDFFKDLTTNPSIALANLFKKLKSTFFDWFNTTTPSGQKVLNGFKTFLKAIANVFTQLIKVGMQGATSAIRGIIGFITDPSAAISAAQAGGSGLISFMGELLEPAWEAIKDNWPALRDALLDLISLAWEKIKPALVAMAPYIAAILFGPAIVSSLVSALVVNLGRAFITGATGFVKSHFFKKGADALQKAVQKAQNAAPGGSSKGLGGITEAAKGAKGLDQATKSFGIRKAVALGAKLTAIAIALSVGGMAIAGAIIGIKGILSLGQISKPEDVLLPMGVLAATIVGMIGVSQAARMLKGVNVGAIGEASDGIIAAAALSLVMAINFVAINAILKGVTAGGAARVIAGITIMSLVYAASVPLLTYIAGMATALEGQVAKGSAGVAALAVLSIAMAGNFLLLHAIMKGITPGQAGTVAVAMAAIEIAYLAAGGLVAIAVGVASIAMAANGLGTVAIIAGLVVIGLIVTGMAEHAVEITRTINSIHINPGFEQKATFFTNLMSSIGDFAGNLSAIIDAAAPSFLGLLMGPSGRDPQAETNRTIGTVATLVNAIGTQAKSLVDTITSTLQDVKVEDLDKAEKVSGLITAVGTLAKALIPPPELFDGLTALIAGGPARAVKAAGDFIEVSSNALVEIIPKITNLFQKIGRMPNVNAEKVKAFSSLMTGIGAILKALIPSGANSGILGAASGISSFSKVVANGQTKLASLFGSDNTYTPAVDPATDFINFLRQYMTSTLNLLTDFMPTMIDFMTKMVGVANKIPDNKLEQVKTVGNIFGQIVSVVKDLSSSFSPDSIRDISSAGPAAITAVGGVLQSYSESIFSSLETEVPQVIQNILNMAKGFRPRDISRLKTIIPVIGDTFGLIGTLTSAVNALGEGGTDIASGQEHFDARLAGVRTIITALFSNESGASILTSLKALGSVAIPRQASRNATRLKGVLEAVGALGELLQTGLVSRISKNNVVMTALNTSFARLFIRDYDARSGTHWLNAIDELGKHAVPARALKNANTLKNILSATSEIGSSLKDAATTLDTATINTVSSGIEALTNRIKGISHSLNNVTGFNIATKLNKLNHDLGLHSTGTLKLVQEPVNLNVTFTVSIDAKDLEKALLEADNSNITQKNAPGSGH